MLEGFYLRKSSSFLVTEFGVPFFLSIAVDTAVAVGDAAAASKKKQERKPLTLRKKKWENPNSVTKKALDFLGWLQP